MKYAKVDTAASGDATIVAAVAGKRIRLVSACLTVAGAVSVKWLDALAGTALSGAMPLAIGTPLVLPAAPEGKGGQYGYLETSQGNALVLNLSGAVQVSGHIGYVEVN